MLFKNSKLTITAFVCAVAVIFSVSACNNTDEKKTDTEVAAPKKDSMPAMADTTKAAMKDTTKAAMDTAATRPIKLPNK
jgi:hypothetical protein